MTRKVRLVSAVSIVVLGLGFLFWNGMQHFTEYYMTVPQFAAQQADLVGRSAQVEGTILGKSVQYNPASGRLAFSIAGGGKTVNVVYYGSRPDSFGGSVQAIVNGKLGADGVFAAQQLLIKCPSHYAPAPVTPTTSAQGHSAQL